MILCTFGKRMLNRQLGQPAIRLRCLTRKGTIPGFVEEYSCYDSLHFWETYAKPTAWTAGYTSVLPNLRRYDTWACGGA